MTENRAAATCQRPALTSMDSRKYPLRRIVRNEGGYDLLECGHRVRVGKDGLGHDRPAFYSRRCRYCAKEAESNG